jgi:hypothetical protein
LIHRKPDIRRVKKLDTIDEFVHHESNQSSISETRGHLRTISTMHDLEMADVGTQVYFRPRNKRRTRANTEPLIIGMERCGFEGCN